MPTQKTDRNSSWLITANDQTWILAKNATITVSNESGIDENGHSGSEIRVLGDMNVKGMAHGIYVQGSDSSVFVGADARVDVKLGDGVYSAAAGADIINHGILKGGGSGIGGDIWSNVENYGTLTGDYGVRFTGGGSQIYNYGDISGKSDGIWMQAAGTYIENAKGSEISGGGPAILLEGLGSAEIVNKGIIRADDVAIQSEGSTLSVRNVGTIFGDVVLGQGEDVFDSRGGHVKSGKVFGGDGNDIYYTSASSLKIVEADGVNTGIDDVRSTASFKLGANVENLYLLGTRDIKGTGNGGENTIYGNKGDNHLFGGGSGDFLSGGDGGNDFMTGGSGADIFLFGPGGDVDHITDFQDGLDLVYIEGITTENAFDALDIQRVNGDLIVKLGGGDKLIIDGMRETDFTFDDLAQP